MTISATTYYSGSTDLSSLLGGGFISPNINSFTTGTCGPAGPIGQYFNINHNDAITLTSGSGSNTLNDYSVSLDSMPQQQQFKQLNLMSTSTPQAISKSKSRTASDITKSLSSPPPSSRPTSRSMSAAAVLTSS